MKPLLTTVVFLLAMVTAAGAQSASSTSHTLLVLPFENSSKTPGLEWIGESFPEVMGERMGSAALYVVPREDRNYAFDRAGLPASLRPSRATLFHIGEQMDADYMVLGRYTFDGQVFRTEAQVLDLKQLRLSASVNESGPLTSLIQLETALAWDLLRIIKPGYEIARNEFLADSPPIRLDAFEEYVRGITASASPEKIRRFREAVRINPAYTQAMMQLAQTYFALRDYESAAAWFARVPRTDPAAREASFYLGLAYYYLANYDKSENAFSYLLSMFPLTEVYNNLGVVEARRGRKNALAYFQKAVQADENEPDFRFNLAVELYRSGNAVDASRQLEEALRLRPDDAEARSFREMAMARSESGSRARLPMQRIKHNYDETSFRQLALEIQNTTEARLAKSDPKTHAAYHVEHARSLLEQRFVGEAGREFREAIALDPANAAAHAGLAAVLEASNDPETARTECAVAMKLGPSAEAYLVLARLEVRQNHAEAAANAVDRALQLEPSNAAAVALKHTLATKLSERAQ